MHCTDISTHYLLAEGGTFNFIFLGATGNNEMFSCGYFYIIRTSVVNCSVDTFLMRSYLHHPDIDGHLLRRYIFMRSYLHHLDVIERQFLAKPQRRKGTEVLFCLCILFHGRFEQGLK